MGEIHEYPSMGDKSGRFMKTFGERIRKIRNDQGLTVKELSELCGVPEKTIYRVETGEVGDPRVSSIVPIISALNCSADEIIFAPEDFPQFGKLRQVFLNYGDLAENQQDFLIEVINKITLGLSTEKYIGDQMAAGSYTKTK